MALPTAPYLARHDAKIERLRARFMQRDEDRAADMERKVYEAELSRVEIAGWGMLSLHTLATPTCTYCMGTGVIILKRGAPHACTCVYRAIFRACRARFVYCATKEKHLSRVSLEYSAKGGRRFWGRKDEEYAADFVLVSRRTLQNAPLELEIFNHHFVDGRDWRWFCRKFKIDRGTYFHAVYRIEARLGRAFRDLRPYALYPLDEYFHVCYHSREDCA